MRPLPSIERGDVITANWLNKLRARAELGGNIRGAGATQTHVSTPGVRVSSRIVVPPILFEIYQPLTYPANAAQAPYTEAKRLYLDTDEYGPKDDPVLETIYCPLALRDSDGDYIGVPRLRAGMYVSAIRNRQSGRWEIVSPNPTTVPFELTENLTFGSNATAKLLVLTGGTYSVDDGVTFEVYDPFSKFCQYCKPNDQDGARGHAAWVADSGRFEIQEMQHQARKIKFAATKDFTSGDGTVTVDGVTYYGGYTPDTGVTSVENPGWGGLDNDQGMAFLNQDDGKYYIDSMITVATDIMTGHRIDDSNNKKFETLWQQFFMRAAETTTSDWRTDHEGADCS